MFVNCVVIVKHYFSKAGVGIFYYEQSRNLTSILTSNKDIMIITVENWVKKTCTSWLSREFTAQWDCPTTNWSLPHPGIHERQVWGPTGPNRSEIWWSWFGPVRDFEIFLGPSPIRRSVRRSLSTSDQCLFAGPRIIKWTFYPNLIISIPIILYDA